MKVIVCRLLSYLRQSFFRITGACYAMLSLSVEISTLPKLGALVEVSPTDLVCSLFGVAMNSSGKLMLIQVQRHTYSS